MAIRRLSPIRTTAALVVVASLLAAPAVAQVTGEDLDEARAEVEQLRAELTQLAEAYEAAVSREVQLADDIEVLSSQVADTEADLAGLRERINERAADMYMDAAGVGLVTLFSSTSPNELGTRSEYLGDLGKADDALVNSFLLRTEQFEAQQAGLDELRIEQQALVEELAAVSAELNTRLEAAQTEYDDLYAQFLEEERQRRLEEERRAREAAEAAARAATSTTTTEAGAEPPAGGDTTPTTAPPPPPPDTSGQVCPINGITSFTDTWGAPRSGGRFHQGVDMLAARGTAVVAVESGSVLRMRNGGLGGITVWLRGDSGDEFYYAHLDSWAAGLTTGQRVSPGTLLGAVGTTGNAPANVPHLHWEYHPGGGGAVNPTPLARSLCG